MSTRRPSAPAAAEVEALVVAVVCLAETMSRTTDADVFQGGYGGGGRGGYSQGGYGGQQGGYGGGQGGYGGQQGYQQGGMLI